jgi:hypothetical protein
MIGHKFVDERLLLCGQLNVHGKFLAQAIREG